MWVAKSVTRSTPITKTSSSSRARIAARPELAGAHFLEHNSVGWWAGRTHRSRAARSFAGTGLETDVCMFEFVDWCNIARPAQSCFYCHRPDDESKCVMIWKYWSCMIMWGPWGMGAFVLRSVPEIYPISGFDLESWTQVESVMGEWETDSRRIQRGTCFWASWSHWQQLHWKRPRLFLARTSVGPCLYTTGICPA